jgi:hypothetical protein
MPATTTVGVRYMIDDVADVVELFQPAQPAR